MKSTKRFRILAGLLCVGLLTVFGLDETASARPRIGLALGGGGARGSAHIGVLKVIEELRIPVDCVVGTSMGAIIGGLYASGMSPDELETAITGVDWSYTFQDAPPRKDLVFRRKSQDFTFLINASLGFRNGRLVLPPGLIQGQKLNLLLRRFSFPVAHIDDFDDLPVPYRAVATDIENGEVVVLGSGSLANAMRASMSVPGVFAPIRIDERLLVDGGVVNNVPSDVARDMGADIVIAVNVGSPPRSGSEIKSVIDITLQLTSLMTFSNTQARLRTLKPRDILIEPQLGDLQSTQFDRAPQGIKAGERAARRSSSELGTLSLSPEAYEEHLQSRMKVDRKPVTIDFIKVMNDSNLSDEVIESRIRAKIGQELDLAELERDFGLIYGLDIFERVDYEVVESDNGTGLVVDARRKSWGPNYIQFGLRLADDFEGDNSFDIGAGLTVTELNKLGGEWHTEFQVGETNRIFSDFFQPLRYDRRLFLSPFVEYRRSSVNLFDSRDIIAEYRVRSTELGLAVGSELDTWRELRAGMSRSFGDADLRVGNPVLEKSDFEETSLFARFTYDTVDNLHFPRHGGYSLLEWRHAFEELGSDVSYDSLEWTGFTTKTWGRNTLLAGVNLATGFDRDLPLQRAFPLGGLFRLSGFEDDEIFGNHLGFARMIFYRRIFDISFLPAYLGGSLEAGNVWQDSSDIEIDSLIPAGSVFLGLDSFLGPVYLAYGLAEGGRDSFYFYIGFPY